jgi:hypothetical protein
LEEEQPSDVGLEERFVSYLERQPDVLQTPCQHAIRQAAPVDHHDVGPYKIGSALGRDKKVIDVGIRILAPKVPYFP